MRLDLLTKIADELEKFQDTPELSFDMRYWLTAHYDSNNNPCGTACCAVGLGVVKIPEFRQLLGNLVYAIHDDNNDSEGFRFAGVGDDVADALQIHYTDCNRLFQIENYPGYDEGIPVKKEEVVFRIREFVKDNQPKESHVPTV